MFRIIGFLLILIATTLAGFVYGETFKKRSVELKELERALLQLENEIVYTHTTLPEAFYKVASKSKEVFKNFFSDISKLLNDNKVESVYEAFLKAIDDNRDNLNLIEEDKGIILDFAKSLGESDIEGQRNIFSLAIHNIKRNIDVAEERSKKNTKMYRYLGLCTGAMIIILLI